MHCIYIHIYIYIDVGRSASIGWRYLCNTCLICVTCLSSRQGSSYFDIRMHIYIYIHTSLSIYIYIKREREREIAGVHFNGLQARAAPRRPGEFEDQREHNA